MLPTLHSGYSVNNQMTGNEARAIRRQMGLSARQVADFLGTNESSIYRWEWRRSELVPPMYAVALRSMLEWPRRHRDYPHHRTPHFSPR